MATNSMAREERNRRFVERGSDRMALITGQIRSLPPSQSPTVVLPQRPQLHHHINADTRFKDDNPESSTILQTHEASSEISREETFPLGVDGSTKVQTTLPDTSIVQTAQNNIDTDQPTAIKRRRTKFFTSKRLNSCIVASENTRMVCALCIAFLVVLSYVDYVLFGMNIVNSESVVASRPLYIILLTDVTVVMARLVYFREAEEEEIVVSSSQDDEGQSWAGAVKLLERGLVVYQAIRGIFIDFSVYAVVVICGLSLV